MGALAWKVLSHAPALMRLAEMLMNRVRERQEAPPASSADLDVLRARLADDEKLLEEQAYLISELTRQGAEQARVIRVLARRVTVLCYLGAAALIAAVVALRLAAAR